MIWRKGVLEENVLCAMDDLEKRMNFLCVMLTIIFCSIHPFLQIILGLNGWWLVRHSIPLSPIQQRRHLRDSSSMAWDQQGFTANSDRKFGFRIENLQFTSGALQCTSAQYMNCIVDIYYCSSSSSLCNIWICPPPRQVGGVSCWPGGERWSG